MSKHLSRLQLNITTDANDTATVSRLGLKVGVAKIIKDCFNFAVDDGNKLYFYVDGCYHPYGEQVVRELIIKVLRSLNRESDWSTTLTKEILGYLATVSPHLDSDLQPTHINVLNGLVDISTKQLVPHSPENLTTIQLPIKYDPGATCPTWDNFIKEVFETDSQHIPWELIAMLTVPTRHVHKAIFLSGYGANGKSTFLNAVTEFLGADNVSNIALHQLEEDKFSCVELLGKLANICADISNSKLRSTVFFKQITGGDAISMQYKFGNVFKARPFAKLVFSANEIPRSTDTTDGFYRRLVIVPFTKSFKDDPRKGLELSRALANPIELSGVLNRVISKVPKVLTEGITYTDSMVEALDLYKSQTDVIQLVLSDCVIEMPDSWVSKTKLLDVINHKLRHDYRITTKVTPQKLGRVFKRAYTNTEEVQVTTSAGRQWGYTNIALVNEPVTFYKPRVNNRNKVVELLELDIQ